MADSNTYNTCPKCNSVLAENAPQGLCPKCLFAAMAHTQVTDANGATNLIPEITELAPIFPHLEITECLGRGGMGVVYKAKQKSLNRIVALKLLAPERVNDENFAARFGQEAHALAKLNHPNIVTIYDSGQAGDFYYFLMEYVDGVNLRQAMQASRFTPDQALAIVPPICDALQYAHDHGIVHRDIKPENILLDRDGKIKIADFGVAKILTDDATTAFSSQYATNHHSIEAGTPAYMSPEQLAHKQTDHRADIYSLGVVLYELLTGELPNKNLQSSHKSTHVDGRIDEIVKRALEQSPQQRFQSATEMKTKIETIDWQKPVATASNKSDSANDKKSLAWLSFGFLCMSFVMVALNQAPIFIVCILASLILGIFAWKNVIAKWVVIIDLFLILVSGVIYFVFIRARIKAMEGDMIGYAEETAKIEPLRNFEQNQRKEQRKAAQQVQANGKQDFPKLIEPKQQEPTDAALFKQLSSDTATANTLLDLKVRIENFKRDGFSPNYTALVLSEKELEMRSAYKPLPPRSVYDSLLEKREQELRIDIEMKSRGGMGRKHPIIKKLNSQIEILKEIDLSKISREHE